MTNRSASFPYVAVDPLDHSRYVQTIDPKDLSRRSMIFTRDIRMAIRHTAQAMNLLARQYGLHGVGYKPRGVSR